MIKSSVIRFALIISFSLAFSYFNNLDFVQAMERDNNKEEDPSTSLIITSISFRSVEDWASLWENDIYPIQIKDLDLASEENLDIFSTWIHSFNYRRYSKIESINQYLNILTEAQQKFLNSSKDLYLKRFLEIVIASCAK